MRNPANDGLGDGDNGGGSWSSWSRLVLAELKRLDGNIERIGDKMADVPRWIDRAVKHETGNRRQVEDDMRVEILRLSTEVAALKVRAGVWGLMGGLLPVLVAITLKAL